MSKNQDHPHLDNFKTHFVSGEPGTTGREPFEDSTSSGPGANFSSSGQGVAGTGHTHGHSSEHHHHTGEHHTGATGATTGLTGSSHQHSSGTGGLTGNANDYSTGAGSGLTGASHTQHNAQAGPGVGATAGAVGIAGHGLTGLSHSSADQSSAGNTGHIGSEPSNQDSRKIGDKIKDALPGTNSSSSTSNKPHSEFNPESYNTHNTTGVPHDSHHTATGVDHANPPKRSVVDKINDALPGTPAKTEQNFGTTHNPATQEANSVGQHLHGDRVGAAGQDSSKYEGSLTSGPRTSGAAGTDRFDSDRTGVAGNVGSGLDRQHDDGVHHDTSQRAPGQKSGGISGLLATSDKDFTGRDRKGEGAYADTDGLYKLNSTGPAGNTALTGREGNLDDNPVAKAATRDGAAPGHNVHAADATTEEHGEKKGLMAKIKDALS